VPLYTDNIDEARAAYQALELRTQTAEKRLAIVQSALNHSVLQQSISDAEARRLRQEVVNSEAAKVTLQLQVQKLEQQNIQTDVTLEAFIASLGLALAVGEASLPDRAISSASASLQSYFALKAGSSTVGLRLPQPESAGFEGLSNASFDLAKIPPPLGSAKTPNLYAVLEEKQRVYSDPSWSRIAAAPAASAAAVSATTGLVGEITRVLASTEAWRFSFLVAEAAAIASGEQNLVASLTAVYPEPAAAYQAAIHDLSALCAQLGAKAMPTAADFYSLASALDATTILAKKINP
jgi:uncharacterized protein YhaN